MATYKKQSYPATLKITDSRKTKRGEEALNVG